jgi:predicted ATPase/class 3 adenylate cyclase
VRCQHDNPQGARFCEECATPLIRACSNCGTALSAAAKFCHACAHPTAADAGPPARSPDSYTPKHLAEKILTSKAALEGERKQVTVLFVDVAGFTAMSASLDPEDVHSIMRRAFELMLGEVHRYEGTINQFLGDGIMALFGAPVAHEDHARRAVFAAVGIRTALADYREQLRRERGITFEVKQGLNTGLVVVGSIGTDLRMDYTAVGDTTNVAARLQQAAASGQVLIAETVHRLVAGYCETRAIPDLRLKGKAEPVKAWEVVTARQARGRLDVERERGLTPLVGRDREIRQLEDCFDRARDGSGQVVFLVGEPGIGKSRLVHELRQRLGERAGWSEGRCLSFGRSIAFYPLVDLLRREFGIEDEDPEDAVVDKIERGMRVAGNDASVGVPFVRHLLGAGPMEAAVSQMDPQERRGELFQALRRYFLHASERKPRVILYEDIHWVDGATEEWLATMMDSVPASRTLHILTHRTDYVHPFGERSYYTRIGVGALSSADSLFVARAMLGGDDLPSAVRDAIPGRTDGNPFFIEEIVKSLQEGATVMPETVHDVITARVDRLPEAPKRTLQVASVIGREFGRRLLGRVVDAGAATDASLRELVRLELIYQKSVDPEVTYLFKHALTLEVAYGSLLLSQRKQLHDAIGAAVEVLYSDRVTEHVDILAHHFGAAEAWPKALAYRLRAAEKAATNFATREAIALYDQAEEAMVHLGSDVPVARRIAMHRARGDLYNLVSDFDRARTDAERAAALAREAGDRIAEGSAAVGMALSAFFAHRFDQALEDSARAISLGEVTGDPTVLAGGHLTTALVNEITGRLDEARPGFDRVIALSRSVRDVVDEAMALVFGAELNAWEGKHDEAARMYDQGIRVAREHGVLMPALEGMFMAGVNLTGRGDYDAALAVLQEGLALAQKVGDANYTPRSLNSLGWLYMECGAMDRAWELNQLAGKQSRERGDHEMIANAELNLADISMYRGDLTLAREMLESVERLIVDPANSGWMRWRYSLHWLASLADHALARGALDDARAHAERCLGDATRTRSQKYVAKANRTLAEIALARRQWAEAGAALRTALHIAESIHQPTQIWKAHVVRARVARAQGDGESALQAMQAAERVVVALKSGVHDPELRASLHVSVKVPDLRI